ncbi:MAG: phosphate-binding protein of an transporter [Sphingomonas bacterium]|nr:phosphate-binding protein of an transporter [Sphingomonas bacterium]
MRALLPLLLIVPAATGAAPAADTPVAAGAIIRVSGSPADRPLIEALEAGYSAKVPGARFANTLHGPESTLAGTYTGTADIAFMARELREPMERMAYQWAMLQSPLLVRYAMGGLTADRPATQIGLFVNRANPIAALSLARIDAVLGAEHLRGAANARTWGDVGAAGGWKTRPIHLYGPAVASTDALFLRRLVMKDSRKWNEAYREERSADAALAAVSQDAEGIAFAPLSARHDGLKLLSIAPGDEEGVAVLPDAATIRDGRYPLVRSVSFVIAHDKDKPPAENLSDFAGYILSPAGQDVVALDGAYLPLAPDALADARHRLETAK